MISVVEDPFKYGMTATRPPSRSTISAPMILSPLQSPPFAKTFGFIVLMSR